MCIHIYIYIYIYEYIYIYICNYITWTRPSPTSASAAPCPLSMAPLEEEPVRPISLLRLSLPRFARLGTSGKFPADLRIPPLTYHSICVTLQYVISYHNNNDINHKKYNTYDNNTNNKNTTNTNNTNAEAQAR